jgi:hypothetical protein
MREMLEDIHLDGFEYQDDGGRNRGLAACMVRFPTAILSFVSVVTGLCQTTSYCV